MGDTEKEGYMSDLTSLIKQGADVFEDTPTFLRLSLSWIFCIIYGA